MKEFTTYSAEETVNVGQCLGRLLKKGDVVCLGGNLGAGKTAFTNGIAAGLGIQGYITSPTFTIVNEYSAPIPLYHFDVYRIADPEEMFEVGFEEYLDEKGVVVIEWAELIKDILPEAFIRVEIVKDLSKGQDVRIIRMEFIGERYEALEKQLVIE